MNEQRKKWTEGNALKCDCGQHEGIGALGPGDRAARYKRMAERTPTIMDEGQISYLSDWERVHGRVRYEMVESHKSNGEYLPRDTVVNVPRITNYNDSSPATTHSMPRPQRKVNWNNGYA